MRQLKALTLLSTFIVLVKRIRLASIEEKLLEQQNVTDSFFSWKLIVEDMRNQY